MPTDSITAPEADLLAFCERKIAAGFSTFCEVGDALLKIRDARLYRASHASFEAYCREKWGMTRRRADQLIEASAVVIGLASENHGSQITTERQARELAKVPEESRAEVLKEAAEAGPVTAKAIKAAAEKLNPETDDSDPPRVSSDNETLDYQVSLGAQEVIALARQKLNRPGVGPKQFLNMALALKREAFRLEKLAAQEVEQ